jgi:hypothetical protein
MIKGASSEVARKEIASIVDNLFKYYYDFFSNNEVLNSDGIRLYKRISYYLYLLDDKLAISYYKESLRDPSLENVLKFSNLFLNDLDDKLKIYIYGEFYKIKK